MGIVDEFYSWVAQNHPGVEVNEKTVETKLSSNPRMGFKRLFQLAKIRVENTSVKIKAKEQSPSTTIVPPTLEDNKLSCFKEWLVDNNLETDIEDSVIKDVIKSEPSLDAKQLYDALELTSVIIENVEHIKPATTKKEDTMSDNQNNTNGQNNSDQTISYTVELANSTESKGIQKHLQDTSEDIVGLVTGWAETHPKTATAVGVGTVALAGYGAYKLAQKIF